MKTERIKENMQIWDFFAAFYFIFIFLTVSKMKSQNYQKLLMKFQCKLCNSHELKCLILFLIAFQLIALSLFDPKKRNTNWRKHRVSQSMYMNFGRTTHI